MSREKVLLIHPPVVRPCEPPPGVARLSGALKRFGIDCEVIDANLEGLRYVSKIKPDASDTWTRRASAGVGQGLSRLSRPDIYSNAARYRRAISDINRVLAINGSKSGAHIGLADFEDRSHSPASSRNLAEAFKSPEKNPFYPCFSKQIRQSIKEGMPSLAGISLNFLSQAVCAFAIAGCIKRMAPDLPLAIGGGLVTSWMKQPGWNNPFEGMIDHVIAGPGEGPILALLDKCLTNDPVMPDFDPFSNLLYFSPGFVLPYSGSSGCYWRKCAFCPEKAEGNPYRPIPAPRVASQLKALKEKYRPVLIHLTDNALSPALLKALIADPPGAPWYGFTRITSHLADPDFCMALKRSGCVMLQLGLESGSRKVLDAFGKGVDLAVAGKALSALEQAKIATYVYLLFGTPWEKEADAEMTLEFTVRHHKAITFLNLAIFNLPAHSATSNTLDTHSFYKGDLSLYRDFTHPAGWQRRHVRQFLDKRFKRHPVIAAIIRNDPPVFTSSHAPFFIMAAP